MFWFAFIVVFHSILGLSQAQFNSFGGKWLGRPDYSGLETRCTSADKEKIAQCYDDGRKDWDIRDYDVNRPSRKFCCYIWDVLSCELSIAQRCSPEYASRLSAATEQIYGSMCDWYGRRSVACALRWWSVALIIIAFLSVIAIAGFIAFRRRKSRVTREYTTDRRF